MPSIRGCITNVRYQGADFCIFDLSVDEATPELTVSSVCVSGHLYGLAQVRAGVCLEVVGEWFDHRKFGKQIKPFGWLPYARTDSDVERFLSTCLTGFEDPDLTRLLVSTYGMRVYDVLRNAPDEIRLLFSSDDPRRIAADKAIEGWEQAYSMSALAAFLRDYDLGTSQARAIFDLLGTDAVRIIAENPYRLVAIEGFTLTRADRLADRIGIPRDDGRRLQGAILAVLWEASRQGHLCVRRGDLQAFIEDIIAQELADPFPDRDLSKSIMAAVDQMVTQKAVLLDKEAGVYLPDLYKYERESAAKLARFIKPSKLDIDLLAFLADYQKGQAIELSDAQREGVKQLVDNHVLVLTGGPGTGKTTLVRTFVRLFKQAGIPTQLVAPTGIAAKRLAFVTGNDAATIHRTFGYNGRTWAFNNINKFSAGAVIVDEMSMVDQELFYRLLDALHPSTMLVLVGDDCQLPSVGPGNVLRELLNCASIPHVRLTQIFRQAEKSDIVQASHRIQRGDPLVLEGRPPESDFQFVHCTDENVLADLIVKMAAKLKSKDSNFQVLSPKYDGSTGVTNLNDRLREALNPNKDLPEWQAGKLRVRLGDRVMVTKNDYELNVYNGDMGKLHEILRDAIVVKIHGPTRDDDRLVTFTKTKAMEMLQLAYCITVHKSQGSEFDTIIMPIVRAHGRMRQRNLFYTGVTRARKKVWLLGDPLSVSYAIENDKVVQRNTVLGRVVHDTVRALSGVDGGHGKRHTDPEEPVGEPHGCAASAAHEAVG
jgi:exodeoxyribonuclease V alpha subunit